MIRCVGLSPAIDLTYPAFDGGPLLPGTINRPDVVRRRAGGKAANVCRTVRALGGPAKLSAIVGGSSGAWFASLAAAEEMPVDLVWTDADTRLCLTFADPSGQPTEVYEPSAPIPPEAWDRLVTAEAEAEADWTIASGSVPGSVDAAGLSDLLVAAAAQRPVALDAHGPTVLGAVRRAARSDARLALLKVNRHEAAMLLDSPPDASAEALCWGLLQVLPISLAVVTSGAEGAHASDGERTWQVDAGRFGPYPTGSGDAFLGALVLALLHREETGQALRRASAAATANAHRETAGDLDPDLLERTADEVRVRELG